MPTNHSFLQKHEHRLLGLMLFSLLAASHLGYSDTISQSFLIVHFGFFLLWQPVVKQQLSFNGWQIFILFLLVFVFIYWFNPWLNAFWSLLLLTLLTGRIFARGMARAAYGLAVIVLFLELVLVNTPELFQLAAISSSLQTPFTTLLLALPLALLFMPATNNASNQIDFIRGFLVVLLLVLLCMSSVLISLTAQQPYLESLAVSVIILSVFLLLTAFLWAPRGGFSGLAQMLEEYLLNIGGPFEEWFSQISTLEANNRLRPDSFLTASMQYLMQQHWICGVSWQTEQARGNEGNTSSYSVNIDDEKLSLIVYAHNPVGPSLLLHSRLLLNTLTFYYRAKLQEQVLLKQAHMQAIYETGSKLTHDVKNILQATHAMTQIINDNDTQMQEKVEILKKHMPILTQRLNTTLEKLREPTKSNATENTSGSLLHWWNQLQMRYTGRHIEFSSSIDSDSEIPVDVFSTVAENLLENARNKRMREKDLKIRVKLSNTGNKIQLSVTDTGCAIDPQIEQRLFKEVVTSNDGFGIGLYQAYALARSHGYELSVTNNVDGGVCFELRCFGRKESQIIGA